MGRWCFLPLFLWLGHVEAGCTTLGQNVKDSLNSQLAKLKLASMHFRGKESDEHFRGFNILRNSMQDAQLMTFDLGNSVLKSNFEFRARFFFKTSVAKELAYKVHCFRGKKEGYFLFVQKPHFTILKECVEGEAITRGIVSNYISNLAKMLMRYERKKLRVVPLRRKDMGCREDDLTVPLIASANALYPSRDKMYEYYYRKRLTQLGLKAKAHIIMDAYTASEEKKLPGPKKSSNTSIVPMALSPYTLLDMIKSVSSLVKERAEEKEDSEGFAKCVVDIELQCDEYLDDFETDRAGFLSASQIENLLSLLDLKKKRVKSKFTSYLFGEMFAGSEARKRVALQPKVQ